MQPLPASSRLVIQKQLISVLGHQFGQEIAEVTSLSLTEFAILCVLLLFSSKMPNMIRGSSNDFSCLNEMWSSTPSNETACEPCTFDNGCLTIPGIVLTSLYIGFVIVLLLIFEYKFRCCWSMFKSVSKLIRSVRRHLTRQRPHTSTGPQITEPEVDVEEGEATDPMQQPRHLTDTDYTNTEYTEVVEVVSEVVEVVEVTDLKAENGEDKPEVVNNNNNNNNNNNKKGNDSNKFTS